MIDHPPIQFQNSDMPPVIIRGKWGVWDQRCALKAGQGIDI